MSNMPTGEYVLAHDALPADLRAQLAQAESGALVFALERLDDGHVLLRVLPDVEPRLIAHVQVTIAQYHEALMNLT
jgi:hypothetical protein